MVKAEKVGGERSLPKGWRSVRFDEMAESITERVDDPSEAGVNFYVGLEHLDPDSLRIRRWGTPEDVAATKLRFMPGDIIFGRRRAYQRKIAVAEFEGICSAHALVLRAREEIVDKEFLPFFMQSDSFFTRALSISVGSLSPTINWRTLARQEFAVPPKSEQRRIASILWQVEKVIEGWERTLEALLKTKGAITAAEFADEMSAVPLAQLCETGGIKIGPFGSQLHASDYVSEGRPVVMPTNMDRDQILEEGIARVSDETVARLATHELNPGDILLPRRGELDRRALVLHHQRGWLCGTGSLRVRVKEDVLPLAVLYALGSPRTVKWLRDHAVGTTMPNLNTTIVSKIPISIPSQARLGEVLEALQSIEDCRASVEHHRTSSMRVKRDLSARLFAGALDVY